MKFTVLESALNQRILLITGWGGGTKLLQPLAYALQHKGHSVELINIFNGLDAQVLQQYVEQAKDFDVIIGWSLGGQLATLLVEAVEQQYQQQKVLITLASNPCFVAHENWPTAMSPATFQSFKQSFEEDAIATLKKFGFMVCQGTATTKQDFLQLQSLIQPQSLDLLKQGLNCLEHLNTVEILQNYTGHQLHLLAKQDFLVSYKVLDNLKALGANFLDAMLLSGSHGLPVFHVYEVTDKICQYLQKMD